MLRYGQGKTWLARSLGRVSKDSLGEAQVRSVPILGGLWIYEAAYAGSNHFDLAEEELPSCHRTCCFLGLFEDQVPASEVGLMAVGTNVCYRGACYLLSTFKAGRCLL
jgi:hypothetical protein